MKTQRIDPNALSTIAAMRDMRGIVHPYRQIPEESDAYELFETLHHRYRAIRYHVEEDKDAERRRAEETERLRNLLYTNSNQEKTYTDIKKTLWEMVNKNWRSSDEEIIADLEVYLSLPPHELVMVEGMYASMLPCLSNVTQNTTSNTNILKLTSNDWVNPRRYDNQQPNQLATSQPPAKAAT